MSIAASLVVRFGEGADSSALVKMEWDEVLNVDAAGDPTTQVSPKDSRFFWIHHDTTKLRIGRVAATHGQIVTQKKISRRREQQLDFVELTDTAELDYIPASQLTSRWYGNVATGLRRNGRIMMISGGQLPALVQVSYSIAVQGFKLLTPDVALAKDESYPIKVYAWMEAV